VHEGSRSDDRIPNRIPVPVALTWPVRRTPVSDATSDGGIAKTLRAAEDEAGLATLCVLAGDVAAG
jgi:hypothetical protein